MAQQAVALCGRGDPVGSERHWVIARFEWRVCIRRPASSEMILEGGTWRTEIDAENDAR